ncbi:MAG: ABC transporter permease [Acetobacteraceae bacterium]
MPGPARASARVRGWAGGALMVLPALVFLLVFFVVPAAVLFSYSVLTQPQNGEIGLPLTFSHYVHLAETPLYLRVFLITLRISLWTAGLSVLLGYPVALVIVRGTPLVGRITTIILVAPLVVSIVVRTYGWQLLLANSNAGVVNWLLHALGFGPAVLKVMYSETAVVIGSLHVFLPMMVLPLASSLARIKPSLEEAARTLGAPAWRVFWRVTFPLSTPGLAAGLTIVFSLTAASYVTPAILGGNYAQMLGNLLEQQVVTVYDWPLSAAIAVVMVVLTFAVNGLSVFLLERRLKARRPLVRGGLMEGRLAGGTAWLVYGVTAGVLVFVLAPLLVAIAISFLRGALRQLPAAGVHAGLVQAGSDRPGFPGFRLAQHRAGAGGDRDLGCPGRAGGLCPRARPPARRRHAAGPAAVAADLPGADHRARAAAVLLRGEHAASGAEPVLRPYADHAALCGAHRHRQPATGGPFPRGGGAHARRRSLAHLPPGHHAADRARHRGRRAVRLHGLARQLSDLDVAVGCARGAAADAAVPEHAAGVRSLDRGHGEPDDPGRRSGGAWAGKSWSACAGRWGV